ncbi:MAG: hypothetical protein BWY57_02520 [Betaproteobacteria bacterium ADurb.Bin341]|nr:MAG: hypothetical protein BWY57_02520 [Betaproteobacteria bacterium ADurb.Bin341]
MHLGVQGLDFDEAFEDIGLQLQERSRHRGGAVITIVVLILIRSGIVHRACCGQNFRFIFVDQAIDHLIDAQFIGFDLVRQIENLGDRRRAG